MKKNKIIAFIISFIFLLNGRSFGQCSSGCSVVISGMDAATYTVSTGTTLCIAPGGEVYGNIILDGGTICNNGVFNPVVFRVDSGVFNNYSEFYYDSTLYVFNNSIINNLTDALMWISGDLRMVKNARYLSKPSATLYVNVPLPIIIGAFASNFPYATPSRKLDGGFYYSHKKAFKFKYYEEYKDAGTLNYIIYDNNHAQVSTGTRTVNLGDNRLIVNVASLTAGQYYIMELKNEKQEAWKLRFKKPL